MNNEQYPAEHDVHIDRLLGAGVFLASFSLYLATVAPGAYWLDSSEFVAAGFTLGIPHPPGHPLYLALAKLASLFPFGSIAFRINLLSGICGAGCIWLTYQLALLLIRSLPTKWDTFTPPLIAGVISMTLAFSGALWFQSIRAEVYTLNTLITLGVTVIAIRWYLAPQNNDGETWRGNAPLYAGVALLGLGLANHHYLVIFSIPPLLLLTCLTSRGRKAVLSPRVFTTLLVTGAIGLLLYAYLPIRGASETVINWGTPTTLDRFIDTITADVFHQSVTNTTGPGIPANLQKTMEVLTNQLHPVTAILGGLGVVFLFYANRVLGIFVLAALLLNLLTQALMDFDPKNPDAWGYLQFSHAILTACAGVGLAGMAYLAFGHHRQESDDTRVPNGWKWVLRLTLASFFFLLLSRLGTDVLSLPEEHGVVPWCDLLFTGLAVGALLSLCRMFFLLTGIALSSKVPHQKPRFLKAFAVAVPLLWSVVLVGQYSKYQNDSDLSEFRAPEKFEDAFFGEVPPGGVLMASNFNIFFNHWHAQLVNGRRPDITIFNQTFDAKLYDGIPYTERLKRRFPRWKNIFDAYLETQYFPAETLVTLSKTEPIFLGADADEKYHPLLNAMNGRGITFQLGGDRTATGAPRSWENLYKNLSPTELADTGTWPILLLQHFSGAVIHLKNGQVNRSLYEVERGEDIQGGSLWNRLRLIGDHLQYMKSNPDLYREGKKRLRSMGLHEFSGAGNPEN